MSDSRWLERMDETGARQSIEHLRSALVAFERGDLDASRAETLERADQAADLVYRALNQADPALLPMQPLNALSAKASQLQSSVEDDLADETAGPDDVDTLVDELLLELAKLHVTTLDQDAASTYESLESVRRSIGQRRRNLEDQLAELDTKTEDLSENVERAAQELRARRQEVDQEIDQQFQATKSQIEGLSQEIANQKSRLEDALTQQSESFREAQDDRASQFRSLLDEKRNEAEQQLDSALTSISEKAQATLDKMKEYRDQVENVAGAVGAASLGARFKTTADQEERSAVAWRRGALVAGIGLVLAGLGGFWWTASHGVGELSTLGVRSLFLTPLLLVGGYCSRQAAQHRQTARHYRAAQLDLVALDPFLANMDDEEQGQVLRTVVALRWFGSDSPLMSNEPTADRLSERMAQRLLEARRKGTGDGGNAGE